MIWIIWIAFRGFSILFHRSSVSSLMPCVPASRAHPPDQPAMTAAKIASRPIGMVSFLKFISFLQFSKQSNLMRHFHEVDFHKLDSGVIPHSESLVDMVFHTTKKAVEDDQQGDQAHHGFRRDGQHWHKSQIDKSNSHHRGIESRSGSNFSNTFPNEGSQHPGVHSSAGLFFCSKKLHEKSGWPWKFFQKARNSWVLFSAFFLGGIFQLSRSKRPSTKLQATETFHAWSAAFSAARRTAAVLVGSEGKNLKPAEIKALREGKVLFLFEEASQHNRGTKYILSFFWREKQLLWKWEPTSSWFASSWMAKSVM